MKKKDKSNCNLIVIAQFLPQLYSSAIIVILGGNLDETMRTEIVVTQVLKQAKVLKDSQKLRANGT